MRRAQREQAGFTLVELLIAMTLMLVVIGATLSVFSVMERGSRDNQNLNDQEREARVATDVLAKRLRNLASPQATGGAPQAIERATATDLMFRTVDSTDNTATTPSNPENLERYRYCLSGNLLYAERQGSATWTATPPNPATCGPSDGWPGTRSVVAQNVVNGARPIFRYQVSPTPGTYSEQTTVTQTNFPNDIAIRIELFVDPDTAHPPGESTLNTRVFLRNQNRPPTALLDAAVSGFQITLNASSSSDPENNPLYFKFLDGTTVKQDYSQQATYALKGTAGTAYSFTVNVRDIGGLEVTSNTVTVTCDTTQCTRTS